MLGLTAGAGLVALAPWAWHELRARSRLFDLLEDAHADEAASLGRRYVAEQSRPVSFESLRRSLLSRLELAEDDAPEQRLRSRFAKQAQAELQSGNVVLVDGWLLAVSEAELFGLFALAEEA